jgi:hypothetical protein
MDTRPSNFKERGVDNSVGEKSQEKFEKTFDNHFLTQRRRGAEARRRREDFNKEGRNGRGQGREGLNNECAKQQSRGI